MRENTLNPKGNSVFGSKKDKLEMKLRGEAYNFSHVDHSAGDAEAAEADEVHKQLDALEV